MSEKDKKELLLDFAKWLDDNNLLNNVIEDEDEDEDGELLFYDITTESVNPNRAVDQYLDGFEYYDEYFGDYNE